MTEKILVLFAHPAIHRSTVNCLLVRLYEEFENITFHDLYDAYPDFMVDEKIEQQLLLEHNTIIFHHPFYWYSAPPIIKQWKDIVLTNGFAYGKGGVALKDKLMMNVITTGGDKQSYSTQGYNKFSVRELLKPFEQTANLCSMQYLPPFVVHGVHRMKEKPKIQIYIKSYRRVLRLLSKNNLDVQSMIQCEYINRYGLKQE